MIFRIHSRLDQQTHIQHLTLLIVLVIYLIGQPVIPGIEWSLFLLVIITTSAFMLTGKRTVSRWIILLLAIPVMIYSMVNQVLGMDFFISRNLFILFVQGFANLLMIYCGVIVFVFLLRCHRVTIDVIYGAVNIYIIVGCIWAFTYCMVEQNQPGSFQVQRPPQYTHEHTPPREIVYSRLLYFSFVTLSTLGFGDITPTTMLAERLVLLEAIMGQFYIAVVVAYIFNLYISQNHEKPTSSDR